MLADQKIVKEQSTTFDSIVVDSELDIGNSRFGIGMIMITAGFIGILGCLCLISGIFQSHSLQDLNRGIITAFTGI